MDGFSWDEEQDEFDMSEDITPSTTDGEDIDDDDDDGLGMDWDSFESTPTRPESTSTASDWGVEDIPATHHPVEDISSGVVTAVPRDEHEEMHKTALDEEANLWGTSVIYPTETTSAPVTPVTVTKPKFNFSTKTTVLIVAALAFFVMVIFIIIENVKITPKPVQTTTNKSVATSSNVQVQQSNLMPLSDSVDINYTGNIYESTGVVTAKTKYLQGTQVIYCIDISISAGANTQVVRHYCSYDIYNSVSINSLLTVRYQQVSNSCFSVNSVSY